MHKVKNCHVVPWYNSEEWLKVYEELADSTSNKEYALNTLLIWKARCPALPAGIESTLSLLQVQIGDLRPNQEAVNTELLRMAYSTAIMRFVNHMLDTETVKGNSLYTAAKNLGIPDWIVDFRHATAHGEHLPDITMLREACSVSLQWLQENYWDKYKLHIQDFITGQREILHMDENKITVLIDLCTSLSICAHPYCKIKNLSNIPDLDMRESIVNNVQELFGSHVDLSNLKTVSISSLINIINEQSLINITNFSNHFIEIILGEDSIFLSQELLYFFSASDFKYKNRLHNNYVQCFEVLLMFLHTNDILLDFVIALINITQDTETQHFKARLSAMWVSVILVALKRSQLFSSKLKRMTVKRKNKDLKQLYCHWFPSIKGKNLMLDYTKSVPRQLLDINYIQPIITTYNPYLIYFIKNLLDLVEPPVPSEVGQRLYKLAEVISKPDKFAKVDKSTDSTTIYTADDLKSASEEDDDDVEIIDDIPDTPAKVDNIISNQNNQVKTNSIWVLASKDHDWSSCPIGILPWQQKNGA